jgi:hypothetical protein
LPWTSPDPSRSLFLCSTDAPRGVSRRLSCSICCVGKMAELQIYFCRFDDTVEYNILNYSVSGLHQSLCMQKPMGFFSNWNLGLLKEAFAVYILTHMYICICVCIYTIQCCTNLLHQVPVEPTFFTVVPNILNSQCVILMCLLDFRKIRKLLFIRFLCVIFRAFSFMIVIISPTHAQFTSSLRTLAYMFRPLRAIIRASQITCVF